MGGVADDLLYRPELPSPEVVTAALSKSMAKRLASSSSNSSLGSLEAEFSKEDPSKPMSSRTADNERDVLTYLTRPTSECSNLTRKFRRNCRALEKYQQKWNDRISRIQEERTKMDQRYEAKKADIEEGVPRITIPDLPKRVARNADGVTKKYAATSHLNRLLKTQYVAEVMKDFIPPARRAKERRRAPAERCLERMGTKKDMGERPSSASSKRSCQFQWDEATEKRFLRCQKTMKQNIGYKTANWGRLTMLRMLYDTDSEIKQGRDLTYQSSQYGDESSSLLLSSSMTSLVRGQIQKDIAEMPADARELIEEKVSSTLTHEASRDLEAWADNRSKFLARKAQQLERKNSFREHRAAALRARSEDAANAKKNARRIQAWLKSCRPGRPYDDSGYQSEVKKWAKRGTESHDSRRQYLARGQLTGGPRNDFAKLYTQEDRDRAAVLIQRFWKGRIRSWRLQAAMDGMRARRLEAQKLAREQEAREMDEKTAKDRLRRSKLTARIFAAGQPTETPDNIRAKLVHWMRSAARCGPSVMHGREVELITMIEAEPEKPDDYGYALEVGCREGHRDGIIFLLSTPGIPDLVRPYMVKCTAVAAMASNERCFELMMDQLTPPELAEFAFSHPDWYRSISPTRRPSVPMASRSRRASVSSHQERMQAGEHAKLVRFVRRKAGNVVRAWRLYFDPRCRNGQINFDSFVEACKEAGFVGDYARAFLEAQGLESSSDNGRIHPTGCITFNVLLDHDSEGTTLRPSEGLLIFRGTLSNTTRTSARAKESEQTERWIRLFETTATGRRISREHFKQASLG